MADNVIEVVLRSINEMSQDLQRINADLDKLKGTTQTTGTSFDKTSQSTTKFHSALGPTHRAVGEVFNAMAALNPESRILVGNLDNLVLGAIRAAQGTGGLAAAFNPLTIGLTLAAAAIGALVFKFMEAKKAQEEFNKTLDDSALRLVSLRAKTEAAFSGPAALKSTITDIGAEFAKQTEEARKRIYDLQSGVKETATGFKKFIGIETQEEAIKRWQDIIDRLKVEADRKIQDATKVFNEQARKRAVDLKNQLLQAEAEVLESGERITEAYDKRSEALGRAYADAMLLAENEKVRNELTRKFLFEQNQLLEKQRITIDKLAEKQFVLQQQQKFAGTFFGATDEAAAERFAKEKQITDMRIKGLQTQAQVIAVADDERQAHLQMELRQLEAFERPYSEILRVINEIDKLEKERLETQIKQTREMIAQLELGGQEKEAERLIAEARLKALEDRKQKGDVGLGVVFKKEDIHKQAEDMADTLAGDFVDRFIDLMEGKKMDLSTFLRDLGRTMVSQILQGMLAQMLVSPLEDILMGPDRKQATRGGTAGILLQGAQSLLSLFGLANLFGGPSVEVSRSTRPGSSARDIPSWYAKGGYLPGNFVPVAALRKFQKGGVARGPTMGIIGEEGDEIVARMKPARQQDAGWQELRQNIYLVDDRRKVPPLGPRDVIMIVADDMNRGGDTAKTTQNVIKRL